VRAAIYTRLSEADEKSTYRRQQDECQAQVKARGWTHDPTTDLYSDYGVSAWRKGVVRPAFEELLAALDRYDVLVAWKLDRLVRSHRDLSRLLDLLDERSVALALVTEGLDASTPMGRTMLEVGTSFANLEATTTGLRVRSAQAHMAQQGRHRGSPVPYGWAPGPHPTLQAGTWLHLEPSEATVVQEMVARLLAGESARAIAHDLNDRGVATRKGGRWTSATILGIVRSPRMVGWQPYSSEHRSGQVARDDEGRPVPAGDAMVDEVTWRRVVERTRSGKTTARSDGSWLNGIALCGLCAARMHATGTGTHATYICSARRTAGPSVHAVPVTMSRRLLEDVVTAAVLPVVNRQLTDARRRRPRDGREGRLLKERDRLRARVDTLDDEWASGLLDERRWRRLTSKVQDELATVERDLASVGDRRQLADLGGPLTERRWSGLPVGVARQVVGAVLSVVEVQPFDEGARTVAGRVRLVWTDGEVSVL
jgi:site-specific DNA recombinase